MSDVIPNIEDTIRDNVGIETLADYLFPSVTLDYANFSFANLTNSTLSNVTSAVGVNFNGANLTGVVIN